MRGGRKRTGREWRGEVGLRGGGWEKEEMEKRRGKEKEEGKDKRRRERNEERWAKKLRGGGDTRRCE